MKISCGSTTIALAMESFSDRFRERFDGVRRHDAFEIIAARQPPEEDEQLAEYAYSAINEQGGFALPPAYRGYMNVSSGTHLRYVYHRDGRVAGGGELRLNELFVQLTCGAAPRLWNDAMPLEKRELLERFRVIDDHPDSGDAKLAAFCLEPGLSPPAAPPIYFYDRGDVFRMSIDYGQYLEALLDLLGASNWQYLFCDVDLAHPDHRHVRDELSQTLRDLSELFPDRDYEPYLRRLTPG